MSEVIKTKVLVVGGGPGGYVAAIRCGQLGLDTVLVEGDQLLGLLLLLPRRCSGLPPTRPYERGHPLSYLSDLYWAMWTVSPRANGATSTALAEGAGGELVLAGHDQCRSAAAGHRNDAGVVERACNCFEEIKVIIALAMALWSIATGPRATRAGSSRTGPGSLRAL